jgi:hypothetical protein
MFAKNKNYVSKFLQLTGMLFICLLITIFHNNFFISGETTSTMKEKIEKIKNKDNQKEEIKHKSQQLLNEILQFQENLKNIFTVPIVKEITNVFDNDPFEKILKKVNENLLKKNKDDEQTTLKEIKTLIENIQQQKDDYLNNIKTLSKANEKSFEEVKKAFQNIMVQNKLLEENINDLQSGNNKLTTPNKMDIEVENYKEQINILLQKSKYSELVFQNNHLNKIEEKYKDLNSSEMPKKSAKNTNGINTFQMIIISVFLITMVSAIVVWILEQINKNKSKK